MSDDGSRSFISNTLDGTASEIEAATQRLTRDFEAGDGSGGIAFQGHRPMSAIGKFVESASGCRAMRGDTR